MSVASMATLAEGGASQPKALNLLASYIPSEVIAVYLGALAVAVPAAGATTKQVTAVHAICYVSGLVVAVIIAFANIDASTIDASKKSWWVLPERWRRRLVVACLAVVAFTLYAGALPGFIVQGEMLTVGATQWFILGALVFSAVLPTLASWLGVRLQASTGTLHSPGLGQRLPTQA